MSRNGFLRRAVAVTGSALLGTAGAGAGAYLREVLQDEHAAGAAHWVYNDLEVALAAARKTGKPIFVTFRCVPCAACKAFDAEVAKGSERITKLASEKFIPLRIVEMKGVPLDLFRFDHDLNWAAMFINADKVVYGRYGTQSSEGPDAYNSIESLEKAMRRVLELHALYPSNAADFPGKKPEEAASKRALEMPGMRNKAKLAGATARNNCIHCHMIHDAEHFAALEDGSYSLEMLYRYPLPDTIGLKIDAEDGRKIAEVVAGSPAERAGIAAGDEVLEMNGQPVVSIADMQWVLHHASNAGGTVRIATHGEGSASQVHSVELSGGWKAAADFAWRGSMWSVPPRLRTWMPPLAEAEKVKRGLQADENGLLVKWINQKEPGGRAVKQAGIRQGDVIVGLAGNPVPEGWGPREFHVHVKLNYEVGEKLPVTVLRGKERIEVAIPLVE